MDKEQKSPCLKCGSTYTYRTMKQKVCRKCGHREDIVNDPITDKEATNNGRTDN